MRVLCLLVLLASPLAVSQVVWRWELEQQADRVAIAEAQRREIKRQEKELAQKWNTYVRRMNGVMSKLEEGMVDIKLYKLALDAWDELERCEAWPYRGVTK